jgi:hypothetical protein
MQALVRQTSDTHAPSTDNGFLALITNILSNDRGSIETLNLITHANPNHISLRGEIARPKSGLTSIRSTVTLDESNQGCISIESLEYHEMQIHFHYEPGVARPKSWKKYNNGVAEWEDIRARFTSKATIVIYACHSGALNSGAPNREILSKMGELFGVRVVGFLDLIGYCATPARKSIRYAVDLISDNPRQGEDLSRWDVCNHDLHPNATADFHRLLLRKDRLVDVPLHYGTRPR